MYTRGERRNHTKGNCALGTFVGMTKGAEYSRSALFSGRSLLVVVRFSRAGGDPEAPDAEKSPRGMALEFRSLKGVHGTPSWQSGKANFLTTNTSAQTFYKFVTDT